MPGPVESAERSVGAIPFQNVPITGPWESYGAMILYEQARLARAVEQLNAVCNHIATDVTVLKLKAAIFGAFAGALVSPVAIVVVKVLLEMLRKSTAGP